MTSNASLSPVWWRPRSWSRARRRSLGTLCVAGIVIGIAWHGLVCLLYDVNSCLQQGLERRVGSWVRPTWPDAILTSCSSQENFLSVACVKIEQPGSPGSVLVVKTELFSSTPTSWQLQLNWPAHQSQQAVLMQQRINAWRESRALTNQAAPVTSSTLFRPILVDVCEDSDLVQVQNTWIGVRDGDMPWCVAGPLDPAVLKIVGHALGWVVQPQISREDLR